MDEKNAIESKENRCCRAVEDEAHAKMTYQHLWYDRGDGVSGSPFLPERALCRYPVTGKTRINDRYGNK